MTVDSGILQAALTRTLAETDLAGMGTKYEGKVRDNYTTDEGHRVIVATDRISAFDRVLGTLPFKGQVLNGLAAWWFRETADLVPNHLLHVPDPNVMVVRECRPLAVEMVVRAYITGVTSTSLWTQYAEGKRTICGHTLPDGIKKNQRLAEPLLTPSTKAAKGDHDVSVSRAEILAMGAVTEAEFDEAARYAMVLFSHGRQVCAERGIILVDTKYEFGVDASGAIVVIDEVHTPDSSRFWYSSTYDERFAAGLDPESFDKEYVRRWLADQGYTGDGEAPVLADEVRVEAARRYIEACEVIRGEPFVPNLDDPMPRIRGNLS